MFLWDGQEEPVTGSLLHPSWKGGSFSLQNEQVLLGRVLGWSGGCEGEASRVYVQTQTVSSSPGWTGVWCCERWWHGDSPLQAGTPCFRQHCLLPAWEPSLHVLGACYGLGLGPHGGVAAHPGTFSITINLHILYESGQNSMTVPVKKPEWLKCFYGKSIIEFSSKCFTVAFPIY